MQILKEKTACEHSIQNNKRSLLDSYGYKKILNDYYCPDAYLFFKNGHEIVPLVVKNSIVTFYGGMQHNHYNILDINQEFLNEILAYLSAKQLTFRLLSLKDDPYSLLNSKNKQYDVPYPATWIYKKIQHYSIEILLNTYRSKKKWQMKRVLKHQNLYQFENMEFHDFLKDYTLLMQLHNQYFQTRNLTSVWEGNESLLLILLNYFATHENIFIRTIKKNSHYYAIYILIYNKNELIYYFGTSLHAGDPYISKLMYFDMLENARQIAQKYDIDEFDALRGAFSNKKRFNFKPKPLYALVHDKTWIVQKDQDIPDDEYAKIYGRNFT